jgi:UDP-3-O-[3-hydroxymyristoyl] N-acetylglucosamine deacetylase/3-hydroxyacyl-[acyl-carrier-protein] dehydratase
MNQQTIAKQFSVEGVGLHTGEMVKVTFKPGEERTGIKFIRTDQETPVVIEANLNFVKRTTRGTTLEKNGVYIHTIEHVLSALAGLQIDNVVIELEGPEMPILDGSSIGFANEIQTAGIVEQQVEREYFVIKEQIEFKDENTGSEYLVLPADQLTITAMIDFDSDFLGSQYAHMDSLKEYVKEIAPSRTFVFLRELEQLFDSGLIKGGKLDNAVVIADQLMDKSKLETLAKKLNLPYIDIDSTDVVNRNELRFNNEPARHKLLDIVGDLSLIGKPIMGKIVAKKPGHTSNVEFARVLKQKYLEQRKLKDKPDYDPAEEPLLDVVGIQKYLPHRYPFLLVDKIIELTDTKVVGIKNISFNEAQFLGHFPNNPVFPGVLQMEALAQTGGILALSSQKDHGNWDTYFLKMDNVKFKKMVVPGDTLILKMELLTPIRRGIVHMQGTAYVGNNIVSEGELTAQIVQRT